MQSSDPELTYSALMQEVHIEGFKLNGEAFCPTPVFEEMWDKLRRSFPRDTVKEEPTSSSDEEGLTEANTVLEVHPDDICYSQPTASRRFKDGRLVGTLIDELKRGAVDPLAHPDLVLSVAKALIRRPDLRKLGSKHVPRRECLWTFDHRRLYAMKAAGCHRIRIQISLQGRAFDEFANKYKLEQRKEIELR